MNPFVRALAAVLAGSTAAFGLVACSNGEDSSQASSDAEIRQQVENTGDLPDPHTLTGVTEVADFSEPTPVENNPTPQLPVELTDADGYDVTVTDVSRIIALDIYGSYTKTLLGLGLGDNIVGRTVSSTEPSLDKLPVVTQGGHNINVEAILKLQPTLVIVDHSIGPADAIDQIRDAGVTVVVMEPQRTIASVASDIDDVAGVVGLPEVGKKLAERSVADVDADVEAIKKITPADNPMRMAFLYARGNGGVFFILGKGTGATDLIEGIGGVDVAAEAGLSDTVPANAEALAKLNPDVFIMMRDGLESTGGIDGLLQRPGVAQTTAGQNQRVVTLPDGQSLAYGPMTGEVLLRTAQAVYTPNELN
ncbi:heme/hemin ABC transporter substrate-binding protein [Corynebacterium aquilae]|uniref:ABC transporter substrate-binding protein n=1 Tax=Corynebacterium aquilae DSM 44791 TaxID=1431546 RepID=A0A1L7CE29_9CORY|nr:ABC transporter substrate-binding protein [Corynebacterium aquilae]APT84122.1 ABC transporter substrate-binding protein [Corynebacterium aquilae DSM 44791]